MAEKVAIATNVMDYAGPAALAALLAKGFTVCAHDLSFGDQASRDQFEAANPGALAMPCPEPEGLVSAVWEKFGRIDVLLSNDHYPAIHVPIDQAKVEDLKTTLDRLVVFPFRLLKAAAPKLKGQGRGNVVMITSCRTELPQPGGAIPDIARDAVNALMRSVSIDLAPHGIAVNAIAPNFFYSEAYFPRAKFVDDPAGRDYVAQLVPAGRLGEWTEMGELIQYLAGMRGSFHTGTVIKFAGGWPVCPPRPE